MVNNGIGPVPNETRNGMSNGNDTNKSVSYVMHNSSTVPRLQIDLSEIAQQPSNDTQDEEATSGLNNMQIPYRNNKLNQTKSLKFVSSTENNTLISPINNSRSAVKPKHFKFGPETYATEGKNNLQPENDSSLSGITTSRSQLE